MWHIEHNDKCIWKFYKTHCVQYTHVLYKAVNIILAQTELHSKQAL